MMLLSTACFFVTTDWSGVVDRVLSLAGLSVDDDGEEEDAFLGPLAIVASCDVLKAAWVYPELRHRLREVVTTALFPAITQHLERYDHAHCHASLLVVKLPASLSVYWALVSSR